MNRGYWAYVMLFSLIITGAAGWYLYTALEQKSTVNVPLKQVAAPTPPPKPAETAAAPAQQTASSQTVTETAPVSTPIEKKADKKSPVKPQGHHKKVVFGYNNTTAKKVFIVADFTKWLRKPMAKKAGVWFFGADLKPGKYEYKFVVDGKKIKDPSNDSVENGNSVRVVESENKN